ncbi:glycine-rich domain-containing protein [Hyphomonas sp.]|uniref:glycine-rich domain-containing protein n=1 Tax=Hyphomonas sp. TaxID=87 RepID=UPI0025BFADA7|nr:hypothetical protein [Hyphomonas sp.]
MASTIKVNTIQNTCGADIIKESSNTITIGASGDTVTLASGASQTGFGRTGTVDWQTGSIKTSTFTAANGEGYFVNTSGGAVTMNLPSSPSAGDIVSVKDYAFTFGTNNLTIGRGGSNIGGSSDVDITSSTDGAALTFIYVDGTKGWLVINESTDTSTALNPLYVTASGGNAILTSGDYKTHVFTGPGTFTVSCAGNAVGSNTVDYLVVAGGAAGGYDGGGGGGAGGFRYSNSVGGITTTSPVANSTGLSVPATGYPITVGGGASGSTGHGVSGSGSNSVFSTITSAGGGGGSPGGATNRPAGNGGSGGGTDRGGDSAPQIGAGNTPPVSPPQGNPGNYHPGAIGGGGGGADPGGAAPVPGNSGDGGNGTFVAPAFFGSSNAPSYGCSPSPLAPNGRYFSGGGTGGHNPSSTPGASQTGGAGGGGNSNATPNKTAAANTGGGGAAGDAAGPVSQCGGAGGSGFVAIRYKYQN